MIAPGRQASLTLRTRPSSALRAPSPGGRRISMIGSRADTSAEIPLPPGEGGRRPGEGRVINSSAAQGAVITLGVTGLPTAAMRLLVRRRLLRRRCGLLYDDRLRRRILDGIDRRLHLIDDGDLARLLA